jgi:hypothetical protein
LWLKKLVENMEEEEALEDMGINGRNILRRYIKAVGRNNKTLGLGAVLGYFKPGNVNSVSKKVR